MTFMEKFGYLELQTLAVRIFVTGPIFINIDGPIYHSPEWQTEFISKLAKNRQNSCHEGTLSGHGLRWVALSRQANLRCHLWL
jgi:hypothetical protein